MLAVPSDAHAGAPYTAVWYPDGQINWFNKGVENAQDPNEPRSQNIRDAFAYLSSHSPLTINEVATKDAANLIFKSDIFLGSGTGMTNGYWDENQNDSNKNIAFSPKGTITVSTVLHEFGHALGFPHEFQRPARDLFVNICPDAFNNNIVAELDYIFNYETVGGFFWPDPFTKLSPYDYASVMHEGYSCVTPIAGITQQTRNYDGIVNPLSVHDINSIYRMYRGPAGTNEDGDRFGHAVATGDYDDDGIQDIAVAKSDVNGDSTDVTITFYRGVQTDATESGAGTRYIPWFIHQVDSTTLGNPKTALATGDFNGDGIDDLAVGQPWYDDHNGRVQILFLNSGMNDADQPLPKRAPWGRKGVKKVYTILPAAAGIDSAGSKFGAALSAAHLTSWRTGATPYDDLVIGAPAYVPAPGANGLALSIHFGGAVAIVQGKLEPTVASFAIANHKVVYNPGGNVVLNPGSAKDEFGSALTVMPGFCSNSLNGADRNDDTFLVGAPGYSADTGAVYLYGCASDTSHVLLQPPKLQTVVGAQAGARYGEAVAGFRRRLSAATPTYAYYAAIGAPLYSGASPNPVSGAVYLDQYAIDTGVKTYIQGVVPSQRSNNDEFGAALAVQQTPVSDTVLEGGKEVYLAIGMPGTKVNGFAAGSVRVWRPWNADGTIHLSIDSVDATNPTSLTDTRFGEVVVALRNLDDQGGFVTGAPTSLQSDGKTAGSVKVLLNTAAATYDWQPWSVDLDQESEGDHRPSN